MSLCDTCGVHVRTLQGKRTEELGRKGAGKRRKTFGDLTLAELSYELCLDSMEGC